MPCGHAGLCYDCAIKLLETKKICHICRKDIQSIIKISEEDKKVILVTEIDENKESEV